MSKNRAVKYLGFFVLVLIGLIAGYAFAETTEIVTYYPANGGGGTDPQVNSIRVGSGYAGSAVPANGVALIETAVGIGTNNPVMPLEVYQADESFVRIWGTGSNAAPENFAGLELGSDLPQGGVIDRIWQLAHKRGGGGAINDFQVNYYDGGAWTTKMAFLPSGNVGIGVIAPNERLEIAGNFRLPATTATTGIIMFGVNRCIHSFGTANFFAGELAGNLTMTGTGENTAVGNTAFLGNTTGSRNTAVGRSALLNNTIGNNNIAIGYKALTANTSGTENTAVGYTALAANTVSQNTAVGYQALTSNTVGIENTAVGYKALSSNNGVPDALTNYGCSNTAVGYKALSSNTTGLRNTALGDGALYSNTAGACNTAIGISALPFATTGSCNTAVGDSAGRGGFLNTTGSSNTFIGYAASLGSNTQRSYATAIGAEAAVDADNCIVLGRTTDNVCIGSTRPTTGTVYRLQVVGASTATAAAKTGGGSWTNLSSDARVKEDIRPFTDGLAVLQKINPVSFQYNGKLGLPKGEKDIGVIAQDVKDVIPYTVGTFKAKLNPNDREETELYNYNDSAVTYVLINAVKELKAENDQLRRDLNELRDQVAKR